MFDLTGQAALVTGASGGIGGAIARALHKQGAAVTLSGTRAEALEQLKAELGERAHAVAARMDDAADIERLAKQAEAAMGKIDILVNNAGITRDMLSMRMKDEDWEKVLQVNLTGTFRLTLRRGSILGTFSLPFTISGNEIDFVGTARFTAGTGAYRGISSAALRVHDHNTLDGQHGRLTVDGFATY